MKEIYRKRGRSVRWENGHVIRVNESGVAIENDERFVCHPDPELASAAASLMDVGRVASIAHAIQRQIPNGIRIERLIVSEGEAEHTFRDKSWRDTTQRIHLALARAHTRVLIDLGDFEIDEIASIADALARAEENEGAAPARLRLAGNVAAALLPSLVSVAPPNVLLSQHAGGIDGKGEAIEAAAGLWPNWYRPSYRVRPMRAPFNLAARCDVSQIDATRPIAIALLAPPEELTLRVLVLDGERVYPATVRVTRIDAIAEGGRWYPYGAGTIGAEIML